MTYLGIDPGKSGGIVSLGRDGTVCCASAMPETERDIYDTLRLMTEDARAIGSGDVVIRAMLERVSSSPQMGVVSAFTFGRGVGGLKMALTALAIPFDEVSPVKWQTVMQCRTGGDKNISKRRAQQAFPLQKVTHAIADALLIAEYGRRLDRGL